MSVTKVIVLGVPVGCLWDVFDSGLRLARVTYHGDKLVAISGSIGRKRAEIERLIAGLYGAPE